MYSISIYVFVGKDGVARSLPHMYQIIKSLALHIITTAQTLPSSLPYTQHTPRDMTMADKLMYNANV